MEKNNRFSIEIDQDHLNTIKDVSNSNIEVFVELEDGFTLTIIVGTPRNLDYLMEKDKVNCQGPGLPWIIVKELTVETIHEAIQAYMEAKPNGYWLKLHHFATDINNSVFDELQTKETMESAQFNLLIGLEDLKSEITKLEKVEKSKKLNLVTNLNGLLKLIKDSEFNSET